MHEVSDPHTKATFQALVDALIPSTPALATSLGPEHKWGAVDLRIDEFVVWELDHALSIYLGLSLTTLCLSVPIAAMLDDAATQLVTTGRARHTDHTPVFLGGGPFSTLSRKNRLQAISLLERLELDLGALPVPFTHNAQLVSYAAAILNRFSVFGYYSEWYGYGTTRLETPAKRTLEGFPPSWLQVGYPGPAYGYRAIREYLLDFSEVRGSDAAWSMLT